MPLHCPPIRVSQKNRIWQLFFPQATAESGGGGGGAGRIPSWALIGRLIRAAVGGYELDFMDGGHDRSAKSIFHVVYGPVTMLTNRIAAAVHGDN
jgi:hypothetical protein